MSVGTTTIDRTRDIRDIVAVLVLSVTAVLTAWCGFEASKWGGEMSIAFSQASSARIQAGNAEAKARDARQFDLTIYTRWVEADLVGDTTLATYIEDRFTPGFLVAFEAWQADGQQENAPFLRPEYRPEGTAIAEEFNATADAKFQEALTSNQRGDDYSLLTVLFALVLFLTAMSQRNISERAARILLGLAIAAALTGIGIMATFPIDL